MNNKGTTWQKITSYFHHDKRGGRLHSSSSSAPEAKAQDGFTTTSEVHDERSRSSSPSDVGAKPEFSKNSGFTLVELIIALGVFTIVVTMIAAGLLTVVDYSSRSQNLTSAVNNLNFVVDDMTRRMRIGYNFTCGGGSVGEGQDCTGGDNNLSFRISEVDGSNDGDDPIVSYRLNGNTIQRSTDGGSFLDLSSDKITIENLEFYVIGAVKNIDSEQTRVVVALSGTVGEIEETAEEFAIQTTITQRLLYSPQEN